MDLLTLPTENLVQIFKNLDITSIENMKNIHSRFRDIILRRKLDYRTARKLTITRSVEASPTNLLQEVYKLDAAIYEKAHRRVFTKSKTIIINTVNKKKTAEVLRKGLIKLKITAIESLHFEDTFKHLDTHLMFQKTGVDFSGLVSCTHINSDVNLTFLDDELLQKILARNPEKLNFAKCGTSVTVSQIVSIIKENLHGERLFIWNFGKIQATLLDIPVIFQTIETRAGILFSYSQLDNYCSIERRRKESNVSQIIGIGFN